MNKLTNMKSNSIKRSLLLPLLFLFACLFYQSIIGQSKKQISQSEINGIIAESLTHQSLFQGTNVNVDNISTFYLLNHGVELNLPSNLEISNKPIVLIQKGDIDTLGNSPYFLLHTFNIEDTKTLVRLYLSYSQNGNRKTSNAEIYFVKNKDHWEIINNQL